MKRREFIAGLGGAAVWPIAAGAQSLPVIGILEMQPVGAPLFENTVGPFRRGLAEMGFIEGQGERLLGKKFDRTTQVRSGPIVFLLLQIGCACARVIS
jgi:hypothetical protein